jgi:hypothetical protein
MSRAPPDPYTRSTIRRTGQLLARSTAVISSASPTTTAVVPHHRRRLARHLAEAQLLPGKTLDSFDFDVVPMISKAHVLAICAGDSWISQGANLLPSARRTRTKTEDRGAATKLRDNQRSRHCVAQRQSSFNLGLASDNQKDHRRCGHSFSS